MGSLHWGHGARHGAEGQDDLRARHCLSRREVFRLFAGTMVVMQRGSTTRFAKTVRLPEPATDGAFSIEAALRARRSIRRFGREDLSLSQISQLLWAAQGITDAQGFRTAPSAGALYPLEVHLVAGGVTGLAPGGYRYDARRHALVRTFEGDRRAALRGAALEQAFIEEAAAALVLCAVYRRTTGKYGDRGIRYVHMEAGHAAQNVYLQAVSLRLGTVVIGAFDDERVAAVLGTTGEEDPLYIMPVARRLGHEQGR